MSIYNYEQACRVLGVEISASANEIKSAYRDLAKRLHPDNHPQQTERIREAYRLVVEAYEYTERHPEEKEAFLAAKKNQQNPGGGKILGATDGMRDGKKCRRVCRNAVHSWIRKKRKKRSRMRYGLYAWHPRYR